MIDINKIDFDKMNGLVPAVITDNFTGQVLMLGFMNREAVQKTINEKKVTFYSRSKKRLWTKGETSGNYLNLVDIKNDCDNDTLLIKANPEGNTCHLDQYSCFGIEKENFLFLKYLDNLVKKRKEDLPENSYTTKLFKQGESRIIQKVGEEAIETVIAGKNNDRNEIINETADLLFHLLVMLNEKNISLNEVITELEKRHSTK
ncbi:MAG: bifunctional phosphoribosyl-AMP cyclohydrolase/phosphoribosyl-ATP diphosphatase HisIE [Melioribacteraceae bacterium]|nr:MAG: bifunctional phosphoribosyl-AMP cyclohydrolase/phosphoribosyl-ATP diphosphatase HisIE [Melioribacteraceae bacterium]